MVQTITGDMHATGEISSDKGVILTANTITNAMVKSNAGIERSKLEQSILASYLVPTTEMRVFDAMHTLLPAAGASDDLGNVGGTFGTDTPMLKTSDAKATTVTQKARFLFELPPEYDSGETVTIRARAGMETTVSDGTATIDFSAYESDNEGGLGSDLVTTAATTINSLTLADKDFTVDPTGLSAGDWLDIQVTIAITDTATGTAVTGVVGRLAVLCDIRG